MLAQCQILSEKADLTTNALDTIVSNENVVPRPRTPDSRPAQIHHFLPSTYNIEDDLPPTYLEATQGNLKV